MRSSSGKVRQEKTGRRQGGKRTEQGIQFDALLSFFRLEQTASNPLVEIWVEQSRQCKQEAIVEYCRGCYESSTWSVSQGSGCLWIQVARAKWQHPGATACNRSGKSLIEYNKVLPRPPPWPTATFTSTLNLILILQAAPHSTGRV